MSNWYRKVEYKCSCGQDYGSCKSGTFFLKYQGVSDTYVLLQRRHADESLVEIMYLGDEEIRAIIGVLSSHDIEGCTSEEVTEINTRLKGYGATIYDKRYDVWYEIRNGYMAISNCQNLLDPSGFVLHFDPAWQTYTEAVTDLKKIILTHGTQQS